MWTGLHSWDPPGHVNRDRASSHWKVKGELATFSISIDGRPLSARFVFAQPLEELVFIASVGGTPVLWRPPGAGETAHLETELGLPGS